MLFYNPASTLHNNNKVLRCKIQNHRQKSKPSTPYENHTKIIQKTYKKHSNQSEYSFCAPIRPSGVHIMQVYSVDGVASWHCTHY